MATIGAQLILDYHGGTRLSVAEAFLLGELDAAELNRVGEIVSPLMLEAARIRLTALGRLNAEHIQEAAKTEKKAA